MFASANRNSIVVGANLDRVQQEEPCQAAPSDEGRKKKTTHPGSPYNRQQYGGNKDEQWNRETSIVNRSAASTKTHVTIILGIVVWLHFEIRVALRVPGRRHEAISSTQHVEWKE